jgi:enoyl-CoA hydratase/carnithine racemase
MSDARISATRTDGILSLTIDHMARRNAMTLGMWQDLARHCAEAAVDPAVRVVTLTGAGDQAFCAGADISQFGEKRSSADAVAEYDRAVAAANKGLATLGKPVIALVNGLCYGGGMGLAMACDVRLAVDTARFRIPAARLGLGYSYENVRLLALKLGVATVADILFTARVVDAREAAARGIVQATWPAAEFATKAAEYVRGIAGNAPLTIAAVKRALIEIAKPPGQADPEAVDALVRACFTSADYKEGQAAFKERRDPKFRGE